MSDHNVHRTRVAIVGAGPAGLMLSQLLSLVGVENTVLEHRRREEIESTSRAGILEHSSVELLLDSGAGDRVLREGDRHDGIELRYDGENHRIDFQELVGRSVWLYPQTEVFRDLAARRAADGGDVRYGISEVTVESLGGTFGEVGAEPARLAYLDAEGVPAALTAEIVVGADGSRSGCRRIVPESSRDWRRHEYPYAWFGILAEAPRSAPELVYADSPHGFALVSQRSPEVQRLYFQCDPQTDPADWDEERIWAELRRRVNGNGFDLVEGPVIDKVVLPFRSAVHAPMRHGRLFLAGDAAHTVPPTGAKGLNLALHDVRLLFEGLDRHFSVGDASLLDSYEERALRRVWKAQHFSSWMTSLLHLPPGADSFERSRRRAELQAVTESRHGRAFVAEAYTGWGC